MIRMERFTNFFPSPVPAAILRIRGIPGDFEATYRDVVEGCNGFLVYLRREGKI